MTDRRESPSRTRPWSGSAGRNPPEIAESRRLAVHVNIVKLMLLAALTPPVVAGIAQRASMLGGLQSTDAIVAVTATVGSLCAVIGALGLGRLADTGSASLRARWWWVLLGAAVGTTGLIVLSLGTTQGTLIAGWACAQLGYSGAMAVLRAMLGKALPNHRRRGAVTLVLGGYIGIFVPLALLLVFPGSIWETTFGLAAVTLAVPLSIVLLRERSNSRPVSPRPKSAEFTFANNSSPPPTTAPREHRTFPLALLLTIHGAANLVMAAFLAYQPLDLAARVSSDGELPVQASVLVLGAALIGLLAASTLLLWKPELLANGRSVVIAAGFTLGVSLVLRIATDSMWIIVIAGVVSGIAVGLNTSALLNLALEIAPKGRDGRFLGMYSAMGAFGQLVGPMFALAVLNFTGATGYQGLFLILAAIPLLWAGALSISNRHDANRST